MQSLGQCTKRVSTEHADDFSRFSPIGLLFQRHSLECQLAFQYEEAACICGLLEARHAVGERWAKMAARITRVLAAVRG